MNTNREILKRKLKDECFDNCKHFLFVNAIGEYCFKHRTGLTDLFENEDKSLIPEERWCNDFVRNENN